ncbi:hypothetical protein OESDEN_01859 [Oesophagostomum dentatum]|uniref:SCP domain-containing protein n=1 Tax=Oesophagostomum dentatum TaxID=61180 RepID=A0A0B1TQU1_OESDE|nr:hypothetical protein OESDEN_01859 [Oesophagostomum dentatum]
MTLKNYDRCVFTFILQAIGAVWWHPISYHGIGTSTFYDVRMHYSRLLPASWVKMAWAETNKIGCSLACCQGKTIFACKYDPSPRILNAYIYKSGKPCQMCRYSCERSTGLCTN